MYLKSGRDATLVRVGVVGSAYGGGKKHGNMSFAKLVSNTFL